MEENAIPLTANINHSTPHEIDEDGWVNYTGLEELLPSLLMASYFCVAAAAVYCGLF